jgi:hypothetical protein
MTTECTMLQKHPEVVYISEIQLHKYMLDFMFRRGVNEIFAFMAA